MIKRVINLIIILNLLKMKIVRESVKRVCLTGKDKVMKTKKLVAKKRLEN